MSFGIGEYVKVAVAGTEPVLGVVVSEPIAEGHTLVSGQPPNEAGDHPDYDPGSDTRQWFNANHLSHNRIAVKLIGPDWDYDNPNYGYEGTTHYFNEEDLVKTE